MRGPFACPHPHPYHPRIGGGPRPCRYRPGDRTARTPPSRVTDEGPVESEARMLKVWIPSTRRGSERTGRPQWVYRDTGMSVLYSTDTTWQRAQVLIVVNLEQVHPPEGCGVYEQCFPTGRG